MKYEIKSNIAYSNKKGISQIEETNLTMRLIKRDFCVFIQLQVICITSAWQATAFQGKDVMIMSGKDLSALSILDNKGDQETLSDAVLY